MQHDKMKHIDACHENGMANRLRGDASSRPQDKRLIIRGPQGIPFVGQNLGRVCTNAIR